MNQTVNLQLDIPAVQAILRALGRQPYDEVNGLVQHIVKSTNDQIEAASKPAVAPTKKDRAEPEPSLA